jgi:hypothetical protein
MTDKTRKALTDARQRLIQAGLPLTKIDAAIAALQQEAPAEPVADLCTIAPHDARLPEPVFYCCPKTGMVRSLARLQAHRFPGYWVPCHFEETILARAPSHAEGALTDAEEVKRLLKTADELLGVAWGAMLKMGLRDLGSDCSLSHEVRMFALRFSAEGRDGPGVLQVRGTGEFMAWRKKARAMLAAAQPQSAGKEST